MFSDTSIVVYTSILVILLHNAIYDILYSRNTQLHTFTYDSDTKRGKKVKTGSNVHCLAVMTNDLFSVTLC